MGSLTGADGPINNLMLEAVSLSGKVYLGAVIGDNRGGAINRLHVTGSVDGASFHVGVLVGHSCRPTSAL